MVDDALVMAIVNVNYNIKCYFRDKQIALLHFFPFIY